MTLRPVSSHFDGERFFNPGGRAAVTSRRGLLPILRWRLQGDRPAWPEHVQNNSFPPPRPPGPGQAAITFIGHASFLIQFGGLTILTDPVFSERASPVGWAGPRRARAPGVALRDLPRIDLILISHNHYDHCDLPSLRALAAAHAPDAVTLLGNAPLLAKAGLRARELDWFEATEIRGLHITATPARHFSRRTLWDGNRALWGGFMLRAGDRQILFAGDSGMGEHWIAIAANLGQPDIALLPIGAYEPRWIMAAVHMNPDEAVRAHLALGARQSIGMHFGTFRLTDEAIDAPTRDLTRACEEQGVTNFGVLDVGETKDVLF
jgi:L-ascorbate metabolism protein UlaG (beta-lactamase superfamily)